MQKENLIIKNEWRVLDVKNARLDESTFFDTFADHMQMDNISLVHTTITDVNMSHLKISNANMSDIVIDGAQMGGALIKNIGMPPEGHHHHDPHAKQRPLTFDNCELEGSKIKKCNLSHVEIIDCNISGMKINGFNVEDLLKAYTKNS